MFLPSPLIDSEYDLSLLHDNELVNYNYQLFFLITNEENTDKRNKLM